MLHDIEYPEPLPLILLVSVLFEHVPQLVLGVNVQNHEAHASDSDVVHGDPAGQVLVLLLVPPEQAVHAPQDPHEFA